MKKTKIAIVQDMLDRYIGEDLETDRFVAEMAILMLDTVEQKQKENAAGGGRYSHLKQRSPKSSLIQKTS